MGYKILTKLMFGMVVGTLVGVASHCYEVTSTFATIGIGSSVVGITFGILSGLVTTTKNSSVKTRPQTIFSSSVGEKHQR